MRLNVLIVDIHLKSASPHASNRCSPAQRKVNRTASLERHIVDSATIELRQIVRETAILDVIYPDPVESHTHLSNSAVSSRFDQDHFRIARPSEASYVSMVGHFFRWKSRRRSANISAFVFRSGFSISRNAKPCSLLNKRQRIPRLPPPSCTTIQLSSGAKCISRFPHPPVWQSCLACDLPSFDHSPIALLPSLLGVDRNS